MIWTAVSTEHLSGTERFDYWYSIVSQAHFRTTMASDHLDVRGEAGFSQLGRHVDVGDGDLVPYDSSRPCQAWTAAQMNHAPQYEECDAFRLAHVTLDLLSATLAQAARTEDLLPSETQQTVLRTRVDAFIQQHLADPGLAPASIATAHQISVRHLHRLCQGQATTIADGIRRSRLQRIHRDLADPRLNARSISSIAAPWGSPEPTSFNRAFKTLYGITPRDHRQQSQHRGMPTVR
ncbi:helix-turn-helix domain-containing protein [Streptomyces sp. NPDC020377]|uniref:helix-turn-helix domain-containing protein n=1 Tax=Streptomyces sp. NPDC020377 TaxID=3365070 RepID=UPI0037A86135